MKTSILSLLVLIALAILSCTAFFEDEAEIPAFQEKDLILLEPIDIPLEEVEVIGVASRRKYCVWTVTSVEGDSCKWWVGANLCFRCEGDTICPPVDLTLGKNFGDGCVTYGEYTDSDCKIRAANECDGKYAGW